MCLVAFCSFYRSFRSTSSGSARALFRRHIVVFFIGVKIGLCSPLVKPFAPRIDAVGANIVGLITVHYAATERANPTIPAPRILFIAKGITDDGCVCGFVSLEQT